VETRTREGEERKEEEEDSRESVRAAEQQGKHCLTIRKL